MTGTQTIFAALLPLIGVIIGAGLQYFLGSRLEDRKHLELLRSQAYVDYFQAVALTAHRRSEDHLARLTDAKIRVCMYGALLVIERLADFERSGAGVMTPETFTIVIELLKAMRKDTGIKSGDIAHASLQLILFG